MATTPSSGTRYVIPRDVECWYCRNNYHARCPWPVTCACYVCYPRGGVTASSSFALYAKEAMTLSLAGFIAIEAFVIIGLLR